MGHFKSEDEIARSVAARDEHLAAQAREQSEQQRRRTEEAEAAKQSARARAQAQTAAVAEVIKEFLQKAQRGVPAGLWHEPSFGVANALVADAGIPPFQPSHLRYPARDDLFKSAHEIHQQRIDAENRRMQEWRATHLLPLMQANHSVCFLVLPICVTSDLKGGQLHATRRLHLTRTGLFWAEADSIEHNDGLYDHWDQRYNYIKRSLELATRDPSLAAAWIVQHMARSTESPQEVSSRLVETISEAVGWG